VFTDGRRSNVWGQIRQFGLRAFAKRITPQVMREAAGRADACVGQGPLNVLTSVWLSLGCAFHAGKSFAQILPLVMKLLSDQQGFDQSPLGRERAKGRRRQKRRRNPRSKHDPRRDDPTEVSAAAFAKARDRMPLPYWAALLMLLGQQFQQQHGSWVCWKGYRLLAIDGTTLKLPSYRSLAEHFDTARNGTAIAVPRARLVLLQFPLARIPYRYELVPLRQGEVTVAQRLIESLQPNDLVLLDRNFWSYTLFVRMLAQQAQFGIRLKSDIKFKTVRRLGPKQKLVRWDVPSKQRKRVRNEGLPESLLLRQIDYQIPGFRPSAVVTSVTDPQRISRDDWVRLATQTKAGDERLGVGLYHRRWEIETTFNEMKTYQGLNRLRSRTPASIQYEVAGHVLLYLLIRWAIVEAAEKHQLSDPLLISFSAALNEFDDMWHALITSRPGHLAQVLLPRLLSRIASHRVRRRPGRHFARPHDTQPKDKGYGRYQQPSKLPTKG
jgi:hypothetical protein